jgi:hypothetical protein
MIKCGMILPQEESYGNLTKMESLPFVKTEGKWGTLERAVQMWAENMLEEKCPIIFHFC